MSWMGKSRFLTVGLLVALMLSTLSLHAGQNSGQSPWWQNWKVATLAGFIAYNAASAAYTAWNRTPFDRLITAIEKSDVTGVEKALEVEGASATGSFLSSNDTWKSPLGVLLANAHKRRKFKESDIKIAMLLLSRGANPDEAIVRIGQNGYPESDGTALHLAVAPSDECTLPLIVKLLKKGADINATKSNGDTPLDIALDVSNSPPIKFPNCNVVEVLLENGAKTNRKHAIAIEPTETREAQEIRQKLLQKGIDVTPVASKHAEAQLIKHIRELRVMRVEPVIQREEYIAPEKLDLYFRELLLSINRRFFPPDFNGVKIATLLVNKGASPNVAIKDGKTALHIFLREQSSQSYEYTRDLIKLLVDKGAYVNAKDNREDTPLDLAIMSNNPDAVELLLKYGATTKKKHTMGHIGLKNEREKAYAIRDMLLDKGIDVTPDTEVTPGTPVSRKSFDAQQMEHKIEEEKDKKSKEDSDQVRFRPKGQFI